MPYKVSALSPSAVYVYILFADEKQLEVFKLNLFLFLQNCFLSISRLVHTVHSTDKLVSGSVDLSRLNHQQCISQLAELIAALHIINLETCSLILEGAFPGIDIVYPISSGIPSLHYANVPIYNNPLVIRHMSRLNTWQKNTIHQVTSMLATSKNVLFPGHNHLLTTSADDPSL